MKTNIAAVTGIGLLVLFVAGFASIFEIRLASAQVDATSSPVSSADGATTPLILWRQHPLLSSPTLLPVLQSLPQRAPRQMLRQPRSRRPQQLRAAQKWWMTRR